MVQPDQLFANVPGLTKSIPKKVLAEKTTLAEEGKLPPLEEFLNGNVVSLGKVKLDSYLDPKTNANKPIRPLIDEYKLLKTQIDNSKSGGVSISPDMQKAYDTSLQNLSNYYQSQSMQYFVNRKKEGDIVDGALDKNKITAVIAGIDPFNMTEEGIYAPEDSLLYDYAKDRLSIFEYMTPIVKSMRNDPQNEMLDRYDEQLLHNLMIRNFSTGDFFTEIGAEFKEIPRIPEYLHLLTKASTQWVASRFDDDPTAKWNDGAPERAKIGATWKRRFEETLGLKNYSKVSWMNNWMHGLIKDHYVETFGQKDGEEAYKNKYIKAKLTEEGKTVLIEKPIFNPTTAEEIMEFAFKQLPTLEKFGVIASTTIPLGGTIGTLQRAKALRLAKLVDQYRDTHPERYLGLGQNNYKTTRQIEKEIVMNGGFYNKNDEWVSAYSFGFTPFGIQASMNLTLEAGKELAPFVNKISGAPVRAYNSATYFLGDLMKTKGLAAIGENELNLTKNIELTGTKITKLTDEINDLYDQGFANSSLEVTKLTTQRQRLMDSRRNSIIGFANAHVARSPYLMGVIGDEAIVSLGAAVGYDYFGWLTNEDQDSYFKKFKGVLNPLGFNEDMGMFVGALSAAFRSHNPIIRGIQWTDRDLLKTGITDAPREFGMFLEDMSTLMGVNARGAFINRTKADLMTQVQNNLRAVNNDPNLILTSQQRRSYQFIFDMTEKLSPDERGEFYDNLVDVLNMEDRIVKGFSPELQPAAKEAFRMTFGAASDLSHLKAVEITTKNQEKLNPRNLRNNDFSQIAEIVHNQERSLRTKRLGAQAFRNILKKADMDEDDSRYLTKMMREIDNSADKMQQRLEVNKAQYQKDLQEYEDLLLSHPGNLLTKKLESGEFGKIVEARFAFDDAAYKFVDGVDGTRQKIFDMDRAREIYEETAFKFLSSIGGAYDEAESLRGTILGKNRAGLLTERMALTRNAQLYYQGKLAYAPIDNLLKTKYTDIGEFASNLLAKAARLEDKPIESMYTEKGKFFRGVEGNRLRNTLNKVADRSMREVFGEEAYASVMQAARQQFNDTYDLSAIQLYGMLQNNQIKNLNIPKDQLSKLNLFEANFFELEEMRKHFEIKGIRARQREKKDVAAVYFELSEEIDNVLEKAADAKVGGKSVYEGLAEARATYKENVFDKLTRRGSYGYVNITQNVKGQPQKTSVNNQEINKEILLGIKKSREGEIIEDTSLPFAYNYAQKADPTTWHNALANTVATGNGSDIKRELNKILEYYANSGTDGKPVFDLRNRSELAQFNNVKKMLESDIIEKLLDAENVGFSNIIQTKFKYDILEGKDKLNKKEHYAVKELSDEEYKTFFVWSKDFLTKLNTAESSLKVRIVNKDGEFETVPIVNLQDIILKERTIDKVVQTNKTTRKAFDDMKRQWDGWKIELEAGNRVLGGILKTDEDNFRKLTRLKDSASFIDEYIKSPNSLANLQGLREANKRFVTADGEQFISDAKLEDLIFFMTGTGLIEKGKPIMSGTIKDLNGKKMDAKVFQDLPTITNILNNKQVEENLVTIFGSRNSKDGIPDFELGQQQFDHLKDIMNHVRMNDIYTESMGTPGLYGVIRPISANEVISRAFNLARGMVSPAYVTAEMAVRIASAKGIDVLGIAFRDPNATSTIRMLLEDPTNKALEKRVKVLAPQLWEFVFTEAARVGADLTLEDLKTTQEWMNNYYDNELSYAQMSADFLGIKAPSLLSTAFAGEAAPFTGVPKKLPFDTQRQLQLGGLR